MKVSFFSTSLDVATSTGSGGRSTKKKPPGFDSPAALPLIITFGWMAAPSMLLLRYT